MGTNAWPSKAYPAIVARRFRGWLTRGTAYRHTRKEIRQGDAARRPGVSPTERGLWIRGRDGCSLEDEFMQDPSADALDSLLCPVRRPGPTKRETKDAAYRRSAIPTRVGSSTRHCWTNNLARFADRGYRFQVLGLAMTPQIRGPLRGTSQCRNPIPSNELWPSSRKSLLRQGRCGRLAPARSTRRARGRRYRS